MLPTVHTPPHSDYDFQGIPFVDLDAKGTKKALLSPCIKLATSQFWVDTLLSQGFQLTGLAHPTANTEFISNRFNMDEIRQSSRDHNVTVMDAPNVHIEQR